jgi:hypothetical protein
LLPQRAISAKCGVELAVDFPHHAVARRFRNPFGQEPIHLRFDGVHDTGNRRGIRGMEKVGLRRRQRRASLALSGWIRVSIFRLALRRLWCPLLCLVCAGREHFAHAGFMSAVALLSCRVIRQCVHRARERCEGLGIQPGYCSREFRVVFRPPRKVQCIQPVQIPE